MRRFIFVVVFSLFALISFAQKNPLAPTSEIDFIKNCYIVDQANIHIPLYLDQKKNTTIRYNWYDTGAIFGQRTRTSEVPRKSEEGTYIDGRLTTYKKDDHEVLIIKWTSSGVIDKIEYYTLNGDFKYARGIYDFGDKIQFGLSNIEVPSKGLANGTWIKIPRNSIVLSAYDTGYVCCCIERNQLCYKGEYVSLEKVRGQLAKAWVHHKNLQESYLILYNGCVDDGRVFNPDDNIGYDCFEY